MKKSYIKVSDRTPLCRLRQIIYYGTKVEQCPFTICKQVDFGSEEIWICALREIVEGYQGNITLRKKIIIRGIKTEYVDIVAPCLKSDWAQCPFNQKKGRCKP